MSGPKDYFKTIITITEKITIQFYVIEIMSEKIKNINQTPRAVCTECKGQLPG